MRSKYTTSRRGLVTATVAFVLASMAEGSEIGKVALLTGDQIDPPAKTTAAGCARILIDTEANTLAYYITHSELTGNPRASHIHGPANPGEVGGVEHVLPAGNPKVGVWDYPEELEADILGGRMYINVHSNGFPPGEIRGQIVDMVALIDDDQSVPPTGSTGAGFGLFNIDTLANELDYYISFASLSGDETEAHIRGFALHTEESDALHALPLGSLKTGTWAYDEDQETSILAGETYVNIHSTMHPLGEIRGQVIRTVVPLDGAQVVPPVVTDGHGCALIARAGDVLSYHVSHGGLTGAVTAAHIHGFAPTGADAEILHDVGTADPAIGQWDYAPDDEANILAGLTYFNVKTAMHPDGEVRGQVLFLPAPCPVDIDCSGAVDFGDILAILSAWDNAGGPEDVDGSGFVDFGDLLLVLGSWGPCE